jgi:TrpR-related protein YerC/YecD
MKYGIINEDVDLLIEGLAQLKTNDEYYKFFDDLLTVGELKSLCMRFKVAKLLYEKNTYIDISEQTAASTATISRINRALSYGTGGYSTVLKRLLNNNGI